MKFITALCVVAAVCVASPVAAIGRLPKHGQLQPTNGKIQTVSDHSVPKIVTTTQERDRFTAVGANEPVVSDIVDRFMAQYTKEMSRSSLLPNVTTVLKAERTTVRGEMIKETESDVEDELDMEFAQESQSQQFHIFLLMRYQFDSSMQGRNRPYVTVMRLSMDCYNTSTTTTNNNNDAAATEPTPRLTCDVLEHKDLPRRNESTTSVPQYLQNEIYLSAPKEYIHNHTLNVFYDALEAQDLAFDPITSEPIANRDTMHYVRFRVQGAASKEDCVVVVEHAAGVNTLRYHDSVCYEEPPSDAAALMAAAAASGGISGSHLALNSDNAPLFVLIACVAGACVAALLVVRQRKQQRSGYSYVHSNASKLSHVPASGTTNTDAAAMAC